MTKSIHVCVSLVVALVMLSSCTSSQQLTASQDAAKSDVTQIGITFDTFVVERWLRDRDVFVSRAEELGAEVNVQNANGDSDEQISQIQYFIDKKVDVIVIVAVDGDALKSVVKKAHDAGIKVIAYDRLIMNADVDLYISFDNVEVGKLMAESLIENLPDGGNVFAVYGPLSDHNVEMVEDGFEDAISGSNLTIVYSDYCEGWVAEKAFQIVSDGLAVTSDVQAVMCGNDDLASQAYLALAENRLVDSVVLVGQDADLAACQRIVDGTQEMTVYKPVDDLAKAAAEYAVKLANNDDLEVSETISDGKNDVLYYSLDPIAVTKDNIDSVIIDSGFHSYEDVYLNVPVDTEGK